MTSSRARNYQRRGGAHTDAKADVYQAITDRMVAALEGGKVPWRQPWTPSGRPRSMTTGQAYRGVNTLLLGLTGMERSYKSPWWGTAPDQRAGRPYPEGPERPERLRRNVDHVVEDLRATQRGA